MPEYHLIPEFLFPLRRALGRGGILVHTEALQAVADGPAHEDQTWARHALLRLTPNGRLRGGRLALSATTAALLDQDAPTVSTSQTSLLRPDPGYQFVRVTADADPWRTLAALAKDVSLDRALVLGDVYAFAAHSLEVPRAVAGPAMYAALFGVSTARVTDAIEKSGADRTADDVITAVRGLFADSASFLDGLNAYGATGDVGRKTVQNLANRTSHQALAATHEALTAADLDVRAGLLTGPDTVLYLIPTENLQAANDAVKSVTPGQNGVPALAGPATAMPLPHC